LLQLHSIIDGVDGELARLLHKESRFGFWFDISADNLVHMAVFGGIALGQHASHAPGPWVFLGLLSVSGVAASFAVMAPLLDPARQKNTWKQKPSILKTLVVNLSSRDFTYLLFPLAVFGWLGEFLWVVTVGTWLYTMAVIFLRVRARFDHSG
jgi:phosphatidylglycerophosphate synthase